MANENRLTSGREMSQDFRRRAEEIARGGSPQGAQRAREGFEKVASNPQVDRNVQQRTGTGGGTPEARSQAFAPSKTITPNGRKEALEGKTGPESAPPYKRDAGR